MEALLAAFTIDGGGMRQALRVGCGGVDYAPW